MERRSRSVQQPPPSSPPPEQQAPFASVPPEVEAIGSFEVRALEPIRQSWEKLGLGALDHRSYRALENRRGEGATLEQLEAAVAGAGADDWIRRRAKVPFAVVFASLASIERFAHEGRKILDARGFESRREAEERRKDREWRKQQRTIIQNEVTPRADELRLDLLGMPIPTPSRAHPMTSEELAKHRAEQLAHAEAWARENGIEFEGT